MASARSWHGRLHQQAYTDFSVPEAVAPDPVAYWAAVAGQIVYRGCLVIFWIVLNCCTLAFGVFVEPLWREKSHFRRLQFPGRIPVIAVALPILLAYATYQTYLSFGLWHVILPFVAVAVSVVFFLTLFAVFNIIRRAVFKSPVQTIEQTGLRRET